MIVSKISPCKMFGVGKERAHILWAVWKEGYGPGEGGLSLLHILDTILVGFHGLKESFDTSGLQFWYSMARNHNCKKF